MHHLTDEQLCFSARDGDQYARAELALRYASLVGHRAAAYCNRTDGFERDDLSQEGFIGLLGAIEDYRDDMGASFHSFALLCIDRKICDAVKAALRKKQIPNAAKTDLDSAMDIGTVSAEAEVIAKDERDRLFAALEQKASPMEKQAFLLYIRGHSYKEIAATLDASPKSIENALSRVRKKLTDN